MAESISRTTAFASPCKNPPPGIRSPNPVTRCRVQAITALLPDTPWVASCSRPQSSGVRSGRHLKSAAHDDASPNSHRPRQCRPETCSAPREAAHAAGQAGAVAHVAAHELGAAAYAIRAARAAAPDGERDAAARHECQWQRAQLPARSGPGTRPRRPVPAQRQCWPVFDCGPRAGTLADKTTFWAILNASSPVLRVYRACAGCRGVIYPRGCELDQGKTLMHLAARNSGHNVVNTAC
jgi:hypothetical protein